MRFVIDTNVIVSALFFPLSTLRKVFDIVRRSGLILESDDTFNELKDVLSGINLTNTLALK